MEELRTVFSIIAVLISLLSVYYTRRFWLLSNRPIVSAEVVLYSSGVGVALFNLVVYNSGNRPAVDIKLRASKKEINQILSDKANENHKQELYSLFSESKISLLLNGKQTLTAFFSFSNKPDDSANILKYEAVLPIKITYSDIEGRKYTSKQTLSIRGSEGFGGSVWQSA